MIFLGDFGLFWAGLDDRSCFQVPRDAEATGLFSSVSHCRVAADGKGGRHLGFVRRVNLKVKVERLTLIESVSCG